MKPRNLGDGPLLRDSPQVFGKPWFWQRSSGAVDGSRGLACVIMEMRDEIKKLEAENRQLRADCRQLSAGDDPGEAAQQPEENPHLRRNASAPLLKGQNQGRKARVFLRRTLPGYSEILPDYCFTLLLIKSD